MIEWLRRRLGIYEFGAFVDGMFDDERTYLNNTVRRVCNLIAGLQTENSDIRRDFAHLRKQMCDVKAELEELKRERNQCQ